MPRFIPDFVSKWIFDFLFGNCRAVGHRSSAGKNETKTKQKNKQQPRGNMEPNTMLATICAARGLYMKNKTSIEAYVTVTLQGKGSLRSRVSTEPKQNTGDCRWDEVCEFKLSDKFNTLTVAVHNKTKIGSGELIGKCQLDLENTKQLNGKTNWLRLKKRSSDEKYRGEVQMLFEFSYEKPSLSISSTSLNTLGNENKETGGGLMSRMKKKIKMAKNGHKQAEDTMSMASAWSATSVKSTKSQRFFGKLGKSLGIKEKSSTLPVGTFLTAKENHMDVSNGLYETCQGTINDGIGENRNNISFNVFDNVSHNGANGTIASRPPSSVANISQNNGNPFAAAIGSVSPQPAPRMTTPNTNFNGVQHAVTSPIIGGNQDFFRRSGSVRSVASSGFGSTKHKMIDPNNSQDLLAVIDSLKLELQVKDSRMKDMQSYMDNLISRVMERNPELLAAAPVKEKSKIRFF